MHRYGMEKEVELNRRHAAHFLPITTFLLILFSFFHYSLLILYTLVLEGGSLFVLSFLCGVFVYFYHLFRFSSFLFIGFRNQLRATDKSNVL